ncbi:MAG: hypothetical protein AABO58_01530 [Acidobacteriota bacterium]
MASRPQSRWAETDTNALFIQGRNAVVSSLDAELRGGDSPIYDRELEEQFAIARGLVRFRDAGIRDVLLSVPSRETLARAIEDLVTASALVPLAYGAWKTMLQIVVDAVQKALHLHSALGLKLESSGDRYEVLPTGVEELDEGVVQPLFVWLTGHPAIQAEAHESLHLLSHGDYSGALDSARKALEMLMRATLGNTKSLENQIGDGSVPKPFLAWLRQRGAKTETVNLANRVIDSFCTLQNAWVKHQPPTGADFDRAEAEFAIYLAFTVMHFVSRSSE